MRFCDWSNGYNTKIYSDVSFLYLILCGFQMAKKLIISFLLVFLLSNMIMLKGQNKFFDESKLHHTKSGFTNPYLDKEFEKKKKDLLKKI